MMRAADIALPVRPGEHACCRFARPEDRERLTTAYVRAGLERGYKVLLLHHGAALEDSMARLAAADDEVAAAVETGRLEIRPARDAYLPDGSFEGDRMLMTLDREHRRALGEGFAGLAVCGEVSVAYAEPGSHELVEYERDFDRRPFDASRLLLCLYPQDHLTPGQLSTVAMHHEIDASPELAPIGREGGLAAARVRSSHALRLAGQLDYEAAPAIGEVLAAHFPGPLRLDLADVSFVDVAGMRALRGRTGQTLTITGASDAVTRLAALLAWDSDPDVRL
jgi:ABC-type transporter Mla MlaB component